MKLFLNFLLLTILATLIKFGFKYMFGEGFDSGYWAGALVAFISLCIMVVVS